MQKLLEGLIVIHDGQKEKKEESDKKGDKKGEKAEKPEPVEQPGSKKSENKSNIVVEYMYPLPPYNSTLTDNLKA